VYIIGDCCGPEVMAIRPPITSSSIPKGISQYFLLARKKFQSFDIQVCLSSLLIPVNRPHHVILAHVFPVLHFQQFQRQLARVL